MSKTSASAATKHHGRSSSLVPTRIIADPGAKFDRQVDALTKYVPGSKSPPKVPFPELLSELFVHFQPQVFEFPAQLGQVLSQIRTSA